jgi:CheY-like chemotaxis protein
VKNKIILVDDNKELLETFTAILEGQGFTVAAFSKVGQASKYLQTHDVSDIHAIISDMFMGPIDGLDFLTFCKSIPKLADIDFYFMTGGMLPILEPLYRGYNIKKIMQKPFSAKELINTLKGMAA